LRAREGRSDERPHPGGRLGRSGLSQPSTTSLLAERLATAAVSAFRERGIDAQVHAIELREHAHDLTDTLTFFASDELQAAKDAVAGADGLIAVTPVFSASYNGLFKTFFDVLDDRALTGTPTLLGATAGTARHLARPRTRGPPAVRVPRCAHRTDGGVRGHGGLGCGWHGRGRPGRPHGPGCDGFAALVAAREPVHAIDPFAEPAPFEQLLHVG
jgi:FMN reductase